MNRLFACLVAASAIMLTAVIDEAHALTVFAAASLKDALDEQVRSFASASAGERVTVAYAGSNALAKQIEAGAPADVFISADVDWMDYLENRRLLARGTRADLLGNRLVLIEPATNRSKLTIAPGFSLAVALGSGKLAMANPDTVPAGRYGKAALMSLGVWPSVQTHIAGTENVRATLTLVARGEAPFGIVYATDALVEPHVHVVDFFPPNTHAPIVYPIAVIAASPAPARSRAFVAYLASEVARATWRRHGFTLAIVSGDELGIVLLSLKVALASVVFSLPVAVFFAYVLARLDFPGKTLLDALVHLPLVLPPVVVGFVLLLLCGRQGVLGRWLADWFGIVFAFRWTGAALASAIMGFPLMVRAIRLSISAIDQRLETVARTLGGSRTWVFVSVTLPLALPGLVTGVLLSFARSLGEFGATITFVSNIPGETETLPLAIYSLVQSPGGDAGALRLSMIAVILSIAALVVSEWVTRRAQPAGRP